MSDNQSLRARQALDRPGFRVTDGPPNPGDEKMQDENGTRAYPYDYTSEPEGENDGAARAFDLAAECGWPIYATCWNNGKRSVFKVLPSRTRKLDSNA